MNHQPCNQYVKESTKLSKSVSEAQKYLWETNIFIEDLILAEINRQEIDSYDSVVFSLENSVKALECVSRDFKQLSSKMDRLNFKSEPAIIDFEQLTKKWEHDGFIINDKFWQEIVSLYKEGGFRKALDILQRKFMAVDKATRDLLTMIENHHQSVIKRSFMVDIEENKIPLRQYFAVALTHWTEALSLFRYSSLISTELYLRDMGYPSLTEVIETVNNPNLYIHRPIAV